MSVAFPAAPAPAHGRRAAPLALALCLAALAAAPGAAARELLDGIAAQVGGDIVLVSEVEEVAAPVEKRMREAGSRDAEVMMMRAEVLDRLIDGKLLEAMVQRLELSAKPEEIDNAIRSIATDNGLTVGQLARSVTASGLTLDDYRGRIKREIERSKVINGVVASRVRVGEDEVRARYAERFGSQPDGGTEYHVRHIVVGFGEQFGRDREAACAIAREGRHKLAASEISFPALARQISNANAERGGELGWLHERDLAAWMSSAVRALEPGAVSDVIEMPFGCNLIQVVERRSFHPVSFEEAAPMLEQQLYREKTEVEFRRWIRELRTQTWIERKGVYAEASRLMQGTGAGPGAP